MRKVWIFGGAALALLGTAALLKWRGTMAEAAQAALRTEANKLPDGLEFRLSDGKPTAGDPSAPVPRAQTTPLSDTEIETILSRLKALSALPGDTLGFNLRESSLPAPRAGQTFPVAFPPQISLPTPKVETGALVVRRITPSGDVPLAERVSITFSQPMIPVTSQDEAAANVPVTLSPSVPGTWRWLGTQTLIFDAGSGKRLPMATEYKLTVPAGTKSATGNALVSAETVTFRTPTPRLISHFPNDDTPQSATPLIWLQFDQKVDPGAVAKTVGLRVNDRVFRVRVATAAEIAAEKSLRYRNDATPERFVALKPAEPLPLGTSFNVEVGPGTPSLEGPRVTEDVQNFSFSTYSALKLDRTEGDGNPPGSPLYFWFNNPLDPDAFDPELVTVSPSIPDIQVMSSGQMLSVSGRTKARQKYTITISKSLKDTFGQTLAAPITKVFTVGPATPQLIGPPQNFLIADPAIKPRAIFQGINTPAIKVKVFAVNESDWPAWLTYQNRGRYEGTLPPGRLAFDRTMKTDVVADEWGATEVDLSPALSGGRGNAIVWWESTVRRHPSADLERGAFWVQATGLGLVAQIDSDDLYAWVSDLKTGKPVPAATVTLVGTDTSVKTARDGMARLALSSKPGSRIRIARGGDTAFLPINFWQYDNSGWQKQSQTSQLRWFVFDDRALYKPGETVSVKGWVRRQMPGKNGDLVLPTEKKTLSWVLFDSRGNEIKKGELAVNAWAGFDLQLPLPATMNLGQARLRIDEHWHAFNVQEFRRPEFEVSAKSERPGPFIVGDKTGADLSVSAKYFAGGALPATPVTWSVTATPASYAPPGHDGFTFGKWVPWWRGGLEFDGDDGGGDFGGGFRGRSIGRPGRYVPPKTHVGATGGDGTHYLHIDLDSVKPARPYTLGAQAVLQDINRQTRAANASILVHPSSRYVGLRAKQTFVERGQPVNIDSIVTDIDGKPDTGRTVRFRASRNEWVFEKGKYTQKEVEAQTWIARSENGPVKSNFTPKSGGQWTVLATVTDNELRLNESELTIWVSGGATDGPKNLQTSVSGQAVTLIPSQKEYKAGETAKILVQAPFENAEGLLTVVRDGIVRTERFTIKGATHTLSVPIVESFLPGVGVRVELVGETNRTGKSGEPVKGAAKRPAFGSGQLVLNVPATTRKLTVRATPEVAAIAPGGTTDVTITVTDSDGKPVAGAEAALVVVDESVLALSGWSLADPLAALYPGRGTDIDTRHSRQYVVLDQKVIAKAEAQFDSLYAARPAAPAALGAPGGSFGRGGMGGGVSNELAFDSEMAKSSNRAFRARSSPERDESGADNTPIGLRTNFDALAKFAPSVKTDASGRAVVSVKVPDNLTRYRIVAVAVSGATKIGNGESVLTARLPLMARPSAPRFLNFGDTFELPIVVQNQTDAEMVVDVAVRGSNLNFPAGRGQRVKVPANNRVEVRFPAEAAMAGTARFQVAAASAGRADAAEISLPVWTPATTEAFATYGVIDSGAILQPIRAPKDVVPEFGGLEVTTTSTALQELTDAYIYLAEYPYGCAEQIASRVLATAALKDVLAAFASERMPKPAEMTAAVSRDLLRLQEMQQDDGGFGFWTRQTKAYPYLGVHVAHALTRAKSKGFEIPKPLWDRSMAYTRAIESKFDDDYSPRARRMITAYALYVRNLAGIPDAARAKKLLAEAPLAELGPETVGFLLSTLPGDPSFAAARKWLDNSVTETAGAAHFAFNYSDSSYLVLHSDRRADAIVLEALIGDQKDSDLIPKLVRGLLDGRKQGLWSGTQENAFVLLALDRYFRTYESVTPDFVARVWLGDKYAGDTKFQGRTPDRFATKIPMSVVAAKSDAQNLIIAKEGAGRLYYRIGMRYAPKNLKMPAADYGFSVKRVYEAIEKPSDVTRAPDGTWIIRAGAKVRVKLTMVNTTRRYHVALVDPTPAGFEALNAELAGTEDTSRDTRVNSMPRGRGYWYWGNWWEHQNLRDERAEAFTAYLWEGVHEFVYVCRATTPGKFVVPPTKAEEMYAPETFGRSATDRVEVR